MVINSYNICNNMA